MKYEDYKKLPFLCYPRNNVPGATDTLPCITTAKGNTEIFNDQKGPDTDLSELTLATALALGLQAPAGSDIALRLLILRLSGGSTGGWLECLGVREIQELRAVAFYQLRWMHLNILTTGIPPLMYTSCKVGVDIRIS